MKYFESSILVQIVNSRTNSRETGDISTDVCLKMNAHFRVELVITKYCMNLQQPLGSKTMTNSSCK